MKVKLNSSLRKSALTLAIIASFGLTGCLNSSDEPSAETVSLNKTTTGVITGFGSVFINGVEYETDQSAVSIDGVANAKGVDDGLKLGMVVTLSGDASGSNGNALSIEFNDEVEGKVTAIPNVALDGTVTGVLQVMGITINTDEDTVFESNVTGIDTIAMLALDNIVEVSGYSAGDGTVWATRIELKKEMREAGDVTEIKGVISGLIVNEFSIGDQQIIVSDEVLAAAGITELLDGMLVEVKSDADLNPNGLFIVSEIELKSQDKKVFDHDSNDDEVEVEGVITAAPLNGALSFDVNGSTVTYDSVTRFVHGDVTTLANTGLKIKVKGTVDASGAFLAQTVVFKPTGDLKMRGAITSADALNNTVTLFGLTVHLVNNTFVEDDRDVADNLRVKYLFGADDLVAGDWLKVKAYKNSIGELVAMKMTRKTKETDQLSKLEGKVDSLNPTVVSGISVDLSSTSLVPAAGDRVELKGSYDATTNVFTAVEGDTSSSEEHYVGGDDAEEHEEEHVDDDHHNEEVSGSELDTDDDGALSDDSLSS